MFPPSSYIDVPVTDILTWTFGNSDYDHDKPIYVDTEHPERTISHNDAKVIVKKLISGLHHQGLRSGDVVCVHSSNSVYYALLFLAVIGAGGIFVGSNPHYTAAELAHLFTICDIRFVIAETEYMKNIQTAAKSVELSTEQIFVLDQSMTCLPIIPRSWVTLLQSGEEDWIHFDDEIGAKKTVACLMSTSGTTGIPKAAQFSHYAQLAACVALSKVSKTEEASRLICLPQFHAFSAPISIILPIREGVRTYIMRRYHNDGFFESLKKYRPTECAVVNPIIYQFMHRSEVERQAACSLRIVWCGGVPLDKTTQNRFQNMLHPEAIVSQVYGMTEIGWATSFGYLEREDTGSAGRLLPNMEARLIDGSGNEILDDGIHGQILLRSPSLMLGYRKNKQATANTLVNGWLLTGDIGYQQSGKWYIIDRLKELIKVRGWQVSPTEIEKCLMSHPAVADVAVIGVDLKDERGELPRAYIVTHPSHDVVDDEIHQFLRERLSRYKALDGGIRRVDNLPRNSTGKVLKSVLKEAVKQEIILSGCYASHTEPSSSDIESTMSTSGTSMQMDNEVFVTGDVAV